MQLTLVSHYGKKPAGFAQLIERLQQSLAGTLGNRFLPYACEQVHGTVIGLEGTRIGTRIRSENFWRWRNEKRFINFAAVLEFLRSPAFPQFGVQVGGFENHRDFGFLSQGKHPFLRSFSIQDGIGVAMGWPVKGGVVSLALDDLRRRFQTFGLLHKWHRTDGSVDNDFFFVLGRIAPDLTADNIRVAEELMRQMLARETCTIEVSAASLAFVAYSDPQLPPTQSRAHLVTDRRLTSSQLISFYD